MFLFGSVRDPLLWLMFSASTDTVASTCVGRRYELSIYRLKYEIEQRHIHLSS